MKNMVKEVIDSKVIWPWVSLDDEQGKERLAQLKTKG